MATPETTNYNGEPLIGGNIVTTNKDVGAGTYLKGQALGMNEATNVYGDFDAVGTYGVLNETDIPAAAPIVINATIASSSGTAVLVGSVLYVTDAADAGLAEAGRDAVSGLEQFKAVSAANVEFSGAGRLQVYTITSELQKRGIVDGNGDQLAVTHAIIENASSNGIILKN